MARHPRTIPVAPGRWALLGHTPALWRDTLGFLRSLPETGRIVRVDLGRLPVYFLTCPDLVHRILVTDAHEVDKGRIFQRIRPLLGNGLPNSEGEFHRRQRRLIQPVFHPARIASYATVMERHARALADSWHAGQVVAVDQTMNELALTTVVRTMFSRGLTATTVEEIKHCLPVLTGGILVRAFTPSLLDALPMSPNHRFDTAAKRLRAIIDALVTQYRRDAGGATHHDDLLSLLLNARDGSTGEAMDDTQIRDELTSFLFAGTASTGITLSWVFHELAHHPQAERRVRAEADEVTRTRAAGYDDLSSLAYTDRVLQETCRLRSVLLIMRRTSGPVTLDGVRLPPGVNLAFSPYSLHRDPRLFPRPGRFDPDRWLSGPGAPPRHAFIPFGAGSRKCIGDAFSWTEMSLTVATIAARWRLVPVPGHRVREVAAALVRPNTLPMVVTPWGRQGG
ncbi:cytochrome P450 [Streptomyces abikoensis]|uniref:cytochrome P450 n=1 Tax=Streptomyces abikoensis TaxID=97398 RepID=UPI0033C051B4